MKIEFILLCVIGLVFLLDFLLKGLKKSSTKEIIEKPSNIKTNKGMYWILNRKKNITLFIISISILKLCIHYFIYPSTSQKKIGRLYKYDEYFSWHMDNLFVEKIDLFIPAIIICLLIVWFLNDKIKAR